MSAIISFIIGRPVKSLRDNFLPKPLLTENLFNNPELIEENLVAIGLHFPVRPGHEYLLSKEILKKQTRDLKNFIEILFKLPYDKYIEVMQSIRLIHLAHLVKKDDFGLAYYLQVSAIESIAQKAIKKEDVIKKHPLESTFKDLSRNDRFFKEIFSL